MLAPPGKAPYGQPVLLWVIGFFVLMVFAVRGKLSDWMGMLSVAYLFLLPGYLLGATIYNLFLRPKRIQAWDRQFLCERCGAFAFGEEDGTRLRLRAIL